MTLLILLIALNLDSCLIRADQNNWAVRNAQLEIEAAKAQRGEALAAFFPQVSLGISGYYALHPLLTIDKSDVLNGLQSNIPYFTQITNFISDLDMDIKYEGFQQGSAGGLTLIQPIFLGGRVEAGNKLAKLGYQAALLKNAVTRRTTAEEVESAYWQVIQLQEKRKTLQNLQSLLDTLYRDVESAYSAGLVTENDRLQIKLRQGELHSGIIQVDNGIRLSRLNLFNLIGIVSDDSVKVVWTDVYDTSTVVIGHLPEEDLLDMQVRAKELERRMTLGEALPSVVFGATYGYSYLNSRDKTNGAVGVMVNVPLTDWGKTTRKMQRQQAYIDMARNERDYYLKQLELQKIMLSMNVETTRQQLAVAEEMLATAKSSYKIQSDNYSAGLIPLSELLITQSSLRDAEENLVSARIAYYKALNAIKNRK